MLNAQLQSAISLADYAKATSDSAAGALATGLQNAASRALPSFSNGYWSYYQLPADPSPVNYQDYVVELLQTLARRDDRFGPAATQFAAFADDPAGVQARQRRGRRGHLLGLEALDRAGLGARRRARALRRRRLAHGLVRPAPASRDLPGDDPGDRLEGATRPRSTRCRSSTSRSRPRSTSRSAKVASAGATTLPPLVAGAGLDQPTQAAAAAAAGYGAVRMTLVWPDGSSVPDAGAIAALNRLPAGTNLVLELYVAAWPATTRTRARRLRRVGGRAGAGAPRPRRRPGALGRVRSGLRGRAERGLRRREGGGAARARRRRARRRADPEGRARLALRPADAPAMDELAFTPAPAPGKNLWPVASMPTLLTALQTTFPGMPGDRRRPQRRRLRDRARLVGLPGAGRRGDPRPPGRQHRRARAGGGRGPGARPRLQDGLDSGPAPAPNPAPAPTPTPAARPRPGTASTGSHHSGKGGEHRLQRTSSRSPRDISTSTRPSVHLGCTAACLYLVTLQRAADGVPVLARRGSIPRAGARTVTLPKPPPAAGSYRFSVWVVAQADPGPSRSTGARSSRQAERRRGCRC